MKKQALVLSFILTVFLFSCGKETSTTTTGGSSGTGDQRIKSVTTYTGNIYASNSIGDKIFHSLIKSAYASGTADRKHTAEFDTDGKKVSKVNSHIGTTLEMYWTYEYWTSGNGIGKIKKKTSFLPDDTSQDVKDITYNSDGNMSTVVWNAGTGIEATITYTYDVNGNVTKWVYTNSSNKIYYYMFYTYDVNNRRIKREQYSFITADVEFQMSYQDLTYDSDNNIIKIDTSSSKHKYDRTGTISVNNAMPDNGFVSSNEFTFNTSKEKTVDVKKDKTATVTETKSFEYVKESGDSSVGNWYETFSIEDLLDK
jgi:hypothetical protein